MHHSATGEKDYDPTSPAQYHRAQYPATDPRTIKTTKEIAQSAVPEPLYHQEPPPQYLPQTATGRREQCLVEMGDAKQQLIATGLL